MCYIVGKLVEYQASGASFTPNFSNIIWDTRLSTANRAILADDLILTCIANRQPVGTTLNAATGYTALGTYGRQSNQASRWFYKKATGGEIGVAYTVENQDCIAHTLIIRGCETTPTIAIGSRKDWTNSASVTPSGAELPTATAGDLVIHSISSNNTSCFSRTKINEATALTRYDASNVALAVAYKQVESAGTVSAAVWYNRVATNGGNAWVLSIKSATGAAYQPDVRTNITETNWYGLHGAVNTLVPTTNAWTKPSTFNGSGTLNGINLSTIALGTVSTSTQLYPTVVGTFSGIPHATSETVWAGAWHTVSSEDMTGKLFALQWGMDVAASNAAVGAGGVIVVFSDGTDWVAYQLASKAKGWGANSPETAVIAIGAATPYRSSSDEGGGAINWAAVTRYGYFWHRVSGSSNTFNLFVRNALTIATQSATTPAYGAHLTGGGSEFPATPGDFFSALTSYEFTALCARQAEGQVMSRIDMVFGDGTNKTYVDTSAVPVSFPQAWSASDTGNWQMNWNVPTLKLYYGAKTSENDTINLTADAFIAPNKQYMVIDAASDTGATVSIAGSSIVGTTFTDHAGFALTSGTFKNGGTVSLKASATSLSVSNTGGAVPAVAMTANNKTITTSTIDVSGTSATYHLSLSSTVDVITLNGVTFTGTPATDKIYSAYPETTVAATAILQDSYYQIKTAGTTVWTSFGAANNNVGTKFKATRAGTVADGTGDAYSGVRVVVDGTGTALVAGDVTTTTSNVPVLIDSPAVYQKVTVSGITVGARVQIYDTTSSTELFNGTASAGDTVVTGSTVVWTDPSAASADRAIRIRVAYVSGVTAKNFIETSGLTCGQTSGTAEITYPVSPTDDTVYNANGENGSTIYGGGEITFVDSSPDRIEMNIAAGTLSLQKQYAAWVYYAFTSAGIATDIDYINAIDTANYEYTNITWKNTSSPTAPLKITGGYAWDSSTLDPMDLIDTAGGTIFLAPAHVVATIVTVGGDVITGDIATVLAAIPSASATATAVLSAAQSTPIYADARKMNGATITGTGIDSDLWRGA